MKQLCSHLENRTYSCSFVRQQIDRASMLRREDLLTLQSMRNPSTRVPLVTTYHPNLPKLPAITGAHLPLHVSPRLQQAIPDKPVIAYRRTKNLRDLLVHAQLKPSFLLPALGSTPCNSSRCLTCQHIKTGTTVQSTSTGCSFNVRATATCKASNVIYIIECTLCNMQYVGETQNALHIRLNGHRNDMKHKRVDKPVAAHFNRPGHSLADLTIMVLELMRSHNPDLRKKRESYWIYQLQSLHPRGLNLDP